MSSIEKMMERLAQNEQDKDNNSRHEQDDPIPERVVMKAAETLVGSQMSSDKDQSLGKAEAARSDGKQLLKLQLENLVEAGYLPDDYEASSQFREFRRIKRPILRKAFSTEATMNGLFRNLVMISSALPGEGKTFCAINLTLNMILERDITVMLMDVDCVRRSLSKLFGLGSSAGLIDVLTGDSNVEDVIVNTSIPQLKILPAGRFDRHTPELLSSSRMQQLMPEIARRYADRIVLMDAPPLLAGNDAEVLSHYAGQALIVVEAESTSQLIIQQALTHIDTTKTEAGLVLNKRSGTSKSVGDGYDYYGDYYPKDDASKV